MVSRARFKAILTGLALYAIAAGFITYFGVNAYTGRYGLNARTEADHSADQHVSIQEKILLCRHRTARGVRYSKLTA